MISVNECRKVLGHSANNLTDLEIESIRDGFYAQAYVIFDLWAKEKLSNKIYNKYCQTKSMCYNINGHNLEGKGSSFNRKGA